MNLNIINTSLIMSKMRLLLLLSSLSMFARAGIVPMDNFHLLPYQFSYNFPYVFSDRNSEDVAENTPLNNAYVKVDLKVKMMGKNVTGD